jgi:Ca-activated chloride channel family protein
LVVPLLVAAYVRHERGRGSYVARFANLALLPNLVDRAPGWRRHLPVAILLVALAAMVVGVAARTRPSTSRARRRPWSAIDVSRSMAAKDAEPSRLGAARAAANAFLRKVPEKFRVGVVSFASRAVVAVPPTADRSLVRAALAALRPGRGPRSATRSRSPAQLGQRERRADGTRPPTAVLLISDGTNGQADDAAGLAARRSLRIPVYTVVLGTQNGTVEQTLTGGFRQIVQVPPSPDTLRQVAQTTGGLFFTARNDARLRDVRTAGLAIGHRRESREMTDVFAGGSAALLLAGGALSALVVQEVP